MSTPERDGDARPLPAAVLFDMDGLLVETESMWHEAEQDVALSLGGTWTLQDSADLVGGPLERAVDLIAERTGTELPAQEIMARLLTTMEERLRAEPVPWRPGAPELLAALEAAGVPMALVSASWRILVDAVHDTVLHELGHEFFAATIAGDDLERTKPHPDPYLKAAEVIGVDPARCIVLEDSHTGSRAGLAAGAYVIVIPTVAGIEPERGLHVVSSLHDLTPDLLGVWSQDWSTNGDVIHS